MDNEEKIKEILEENAKLKQELQATKEQFRLLVCSGCVRPQVKQTVFKTRDANSAINIMNLTKCWIEKQERPACFSQIPSFTTSNIKKEVEKVRPS